MQMRYLSACRLVVVFTITLAAINAHADSVKTVASTIPTNGDVNPYGVAIVPTTTGSLTQGNILVSNFNNSDNLQGTGSTIVQISPDGAVSLFAQINSKNLPSPCPGGVGLTTALVALKSGWVVVGSLPTTNGKAPTAKAGCLLVLDSSGKVAETFFGSLINGPWDMTAADFGNQASLFVTNVLNGTVAANGKVVNEGTVVRLNLTIAQGSAPNLESITVIGSGFPERTDPAALVIGPTGVGLGEFNEVLYVADSLDNRIAAIVDPVDRDSSAGDGITISKGGALNDPLGLTVSPDGNIVTVNGNNGFEVVTTPFGQQLTKTLLDKMGTPPGSGALFGLEFEDGKLYFVDDDENSLNVLE